MRLEINDDDLSGKGCHPQVIRAAAYFLLHAIGDIKDDETVVPTGTNVAPPAPPVASAATMATAVPSAAASVAANSLTTPPAATVSAPVSNIPPPPPPPPPVDSSGDAGDEDDESNVVQGNFPQAGSAVPPPPPSTSTANTAGTVTVSSHASGAAAAPGVVSAEYDKAGMPWDVRIHQKAKGVKKDGTWKLIKGIDTNIVQAVTAELSARKSPAAGSLPPSGNTVPVPPVSNVPAAPGVPAPPAGASSTVPVPPSPAVGSMGASAYRALIDKITELTRGGKITPAKVSEVCQSHGAPSLMALNGMQHLIADVDKSIDAAALGLL